MVVRTKTELRHTAYHEAGHAVVGRVLGLTLGEATIIPDHEAMIAGYSKSFILASIADWEVRGRWRHVPLFRASIFELMAGREAEIVCLGRSCDGDGEDIREIEFSGRLSEAEIPGYSEKVVVEDGREFTDITLPKAWLKRARTKTRGLVHRHRMAIECVAAALLEKQRLSAREIDRIIKQAGSYVVTRVSRQEHLNDSRMMLARQWARSPSSLKHVRARSQFYRKLVPLRAAATGRRSGSRS
jgi:ATP-dependent Zn protease